MTFYLITKLSEVQDSIIEGKIKKDGSVWELITTHLKDSFLSLFPNTKTVLENHGFISTAEGKLEIKVPDLYVSFEDRILKEFKGVVDREHVDISAELESTEALYEAIEEFSPVSENVKFDIGKFQRLCQETEVDPRSVAKIIAAVLDNRSGVSLSSGDVTTDNVVKAIEGPGVNAPEPRIETLDELPLHGLTGHKPEFEFKDEEGEVVDLDDFHNMNADLLDQPVKMSVVYTGSKKVRQMKNYLDYLSASLSATVSNLKKLLKDTSGASIAKTEKVGVFDVRSNQWILRPSEVNHSWGVVRTKNDFKVVLLKFEDEKPLCEQSWLRVAVSTDTKVFSDLKKLSNLRKLLVNGEPPEPNAQVILVDGVPGCGKTKEIIEKCDFSQDLIITPGRDAAEMIRRRANKTHAIATKDNVRTADSFLMNVKPMQFKRLFIDEGLMLHPGCISFIISLSFCTTVYIYGDTKQIPFINRVKNFSIPEDLLKLHVDDVEYRSTTTRCPKDVTHFLNNKYKRTVMCTSDVERSVDATIVPGKARFNATSFELPGKVVTFTQADKDYLKKSGYDNVSTVHEIQGETYDTVSLVRATATPLEITNSGSPHVLVALTRHTKWLKYYSVTMDSVVKQIYDLKGVSQFLLDIYSVHEPVQ
jgi:hypothetical protein